MKEEKRAQIMRSGLVWRTGLLCIVGKCVSMH